MDLNDVAEFASTFMDGFNRLDYKGEQLTDPSYKIEIDGVTYYYNDFDRYNLVDYLFKNNLISFDTLYPLSKSYCDKDLFIWFKNNGEASLCK